MTSACQGLSKGLRVHIPVPPAIMPTDFTVLITGLDFLSGRMANFPEERRRRRWGDPSSQTCQAWGWTGWSTCLCFGGLRRGWPPYTQPASWGQGEDGMVAMSAENSRRVSPSFPPQTVRGEGGGAALRLGSQRRSGSMLSLVWFQTKPICGQPVTPVLAYFPPIQPGKLRPQRGDCLPNKGHPAQPFTVPAGVSRHSSPNHLCPGRPAARSGPGTQWCLQSSCFPGTETSSLQQETWDGCL